MSRLEVMLHTRYIAVNVLPGLKKERKKNLLPSHRRKYMNNFATAFVHMSGRLQTLYVSAFKFRSKRILAKKWKPFHRVIIK